MQKILYDEMQRAIDAAWASDAPECRRMQEELFPEGKPSVELFVARMAEYARENGPCS